MIDKMYTYEFQRGSGTTLYDQQGNSIFLQGSDETDFLDRMDHHCITDKQEQIFIQEFFE